VLDGLVPFAPSLVQNSSVIIFRVLTDSRLLLRFVRRSHLQSIVVVLVVVVAPSSVPGLRLVLNVYSFVRIYSPILLWVLVGCGQYKSPKLSSLALQPQRCGTAQTHPAIHQRFEPIGPFPTCLAVRQLKTFFLACL
jgi:hypothetical protein